MVLNEKLFLLNGYFDTLKTEVSLMENGRKASGARARKLALVMKKEFHELRKEISETLKAMPVKKKGVASKTEDVNSQTEDILVSETETVPVDIIPKKRGPKKKTEMLI
jgi:hypothetical protein